MRTDLALAALASAAVPGMKPVAVAGIGLLDEGGASELQSALVEDATGRRWVVRAPLTAVAGARLQRNDELVRQLSRHVPFKVPAAVGYAPLGKEGSAAVYPHVEGAPLDLRRLPAGPGLASAVGRALAAVHNIPRAVFEEQDVPVFDASDARQRAIAEVDRAAETGRVPTGLLARWEEAFEAAPLWQFATTPVHGALTGASVVVAFTDEDDAASGRVVAVTDWGEAMVGDPAVDLADIWSQCSRQAWEAVLESYTLARAHRPDTYLQARARLVAELRTLRGLARAVADADEEATRRAVEALRRVDRLTEADDSLVPVTARSSGTADGPRAEAVGPDVSLDADETDHGLGDVDRPPASGLSIQDEHVGGTPEVLPADDDLSEPGQAPPGEEPDADATMEVPAPSAEQVGLAEPEVGVDEDATVQIDTMATGSAADEAGSPDGPARSDDTSPPAELAPLDDDTVPSDELSDDDPTDVGEGPERGEEPERSDVPEPSEELEDEERLHELYGMPSPDRDNDLR